MAAYRRQTDPGLLLNAHVQRGGQQDGQQALEQIAEQRADRQTLAGQTKHIGGTGVAGATGARVGYSGQAAEQYGE